jgi:4a-hydroxytetrahydrobiopterin dehydratase
MTAPVTRTQASRAVEPAGWRYVLGSLMTTITVGSLAQAIDVAAAAAAVCGPDSDEHLRLSATVDRVDLELQSHDVSAVTQRDVDLSSAVSDAIRALGFETTPRGTGRSVQKLEIAIDAMDIPSIRPFWRAVLGYTDEPGYAGPTDAVVDPTGQGPAVWFQQMDHPRPQRNRIHLDVSVPHDEADRRIEAALAAGGRLVDDTRARAFWVLADAEGNEACITTWQDRD